MLITTKFESIDKSFLEKQYYTAILVESSSETYDRLISKINIFPYWEFRQNCEFNHSKLDLNGLVLSATDTRWRFLYPPIGWNCSCCVSPRLPNEVEVLELDKMKNRADMILSNLNINNIWSSMP